MEAAVEADERVVVLRREEPVVGQPLVDREELRRELVVLLIFQRQLALRFDPLSLAHADEHRLDPFARLMKREGAWIVVAARELTRFEEDFVALAGVQHPIAHAAARERRRGKERHADLNLKRIDLEKKALEQLRAEKIRQLEIELYSSTSPLQKKVDLLTQKKTLIEQQNSLISAQDRLESASFNLAKQRSGFAIEDAMAAGGEAAAKGLEAAAAQDQLKFTQLQNASKLESIKLGLEQKAIDTDMAQLQSQIALLQSQANLEKAVAEGKSKIQIDALNREVALRTQQVDLTAKAAENQKIIGGKELETARIEGQIAIERDQRAIDKANGTTGAAFNPGYSPGASAGRFEATRSAPVAPLPPPKPVEKEEKGSAKFTFEPGERIEIIGKASDAVAKSGESFGKSLEKAVGAVDQFSNKLTTGKTAPIPVKATPAPAPNPPTVQNNPEERSQPKPAEGEKPKSGEASNSLKLFSGYLKDATGIVEMFEREIYEAAMQAKSRNTGKTISELVEDRGREARGEKISPNPKKQENPIEPSTSKLGKSLEVASTAIDGFANDLTKGAKRFPEAQSLLPQKFPDAQSLLPQKFAEAQSLLPQKFAEAQSLLPQRFPRRSITSSSEIY